MVVLATLAELVEDKFVTSLKSNSLCFSELSLDDGCLQYDTVIHEVNFLDYF